jgi:hypothetical protein
MPTISPRFNALFMTLVLVLSAHFFVGCTRIDHVYLTWQHDPRTTMTVNFQSPEHYEALKLAYDTESHGGVAADYPLSAEGTVVRQIPGLRDERYIYHIEATDLVPGETYYFVLSANGESVTDELRFRPLPPGDAPLRFISGGDMTILPRAHQLTGLAGENDPMFALIGGDIAYDNGKLSSAWVWDHWFAMWESNMVTSDGVMVPMVLAIGNHEVNDKEGTLQERAPFYYGFFAQGGLPYFSRQLRDDTLLIVLDSGHTILHAEQIPWLDQTLSDAQGFKNTIAVYHAPLYPSHRDFEDWRAVAGRENWLPIFDRYGLSVAFENHDHSFKRSKVLKGNQVSETGTVYLGDGSFGVNPREAVDPGRWYLEKASGTPHFWVVTIDQAGMHFKAISQAEETLDELTIE